MSDRYDNTAYGNRFRVPSSRAYHKYWQGYAERTVVQPNGKTKIERYYAAPWKQPDLSGKAWIALKILYFAFAAAAIALFLLATTRDTPSNHCWYSALVGLPAGLLLFWLLAMVLNYMTAPYKMTLGEYDSRRKLRWISVAAASMLMLVALSNVLYFLLSAEKNGMELVCAALLVLAGAMCAAIFWVEAKLSYSDIPNEAQVPEDCLPIR